MYDQALQRQISQASANNVGNTTNLVIGQNQGGGAGTASYYDEQLARHLLNKGYSPAHLNMRSFPLFKISYVPRCKVHKAKQEKIIE